MSLIEKRPNILFIMSDDHASNAISAYGSRLASVFKTPNMDRIANEGVRCDNFFSTNSICTPARATILTGQHGHVNGVRTLSDDFDPTSDTFVLHLKEAGYQTGLVGKWHLHTEPVGFDEYKYLDSPGDNRGAGQQGRYWNPQFVEKEAGFVEHEGYVTDIITDMAVEFLQNRDTDKPFCLLCHHKAPHDFWEFASRHEHIFDGVDIPEPESLFEDRSHRSEASREYGSSIGPRNEVRSLYKHFCQENYVTGPLVGTEAMTFEEKTRVAYQKYLKDYLRTVAGIDDSVGTLLDELEEQGILDETIVIYTSDQGMFLGEHDYQDKRWSYEESLKCPFLVRYPKEIPAGSVNDDILSNVDLASTFMDYAGLAPTEAMQGRSIRHALADQTPEDWDQAVYYRYWMHRAHKHDNPAHYGVRTKKWKLIFYYGLPLDAAGCFKEPSPAGWELYDMENDPLEMHNCYTDPTKAAIVRELTDQLDALKAKVGDADEAYPEVVEFRQQHAPPGGKGGGFGGKLGTFLMTFQVPLIIGLWACLAAATTLSAAALPTWFVDIIAAERLLPPGMAFPQATHSLNLLPLLFAGASKVR